MSPRIGALFAGYGGIELASRIVWPDADLAWVSEFDAAPSRILAHHWPTVPNLGDVTRIDWSAVEPVDVITGGSPCQDLSAAGKRAGMRVGTRSGLWASMCDAVDILRPSLVIWENVRGALSACASSDSDSHLGQCPRCMDPSGRRKHDPNLRALGRVLGDLASLGYDAAWTGLRAADVGAPHGRWRVFVVAWPQGDRSALTWPQGDRSALTWPQGDRSALLPTPAVNDMGAAYTLDEWDEWTARMKAAHANGNGHGASLHIEALRMLPTPRSSDTNGAGSHGDGGIDLRTAVSLLPTPRATDGTKGGPNQRGSSGDLMLPSAVLLLPTPSVADSKGSGGKVGSADVTLTDATERADVRGIDFGIYTSAIARWEAILGRPAPSPIERDWERWEKARNHRLSSKRPVGLRGSIRFIVDGPRPLLSPRFVEWMQGLPDGWVTDVPGITRNHALKALGNGVVPQQAGAAIPWLLDVMARGLAVAA